MEASLEVPNLGIATVYRNIKTMVDQQELVPIELPGQPARYTLPIHVKDYVFLCEKSDRAFFIDKTAINFELIEMDPSFHVTGHSVILYGEYRDPTHVTQTRAPFAALRVS